MDDFEAYQTAVDVDKEEYMGSLNRSLSLVMDEFYRWHRQEKLAGSYIDTDNMKLVNFVFWNQFNLFNLSWSFD